MASCMIHCVIIFITFFICKCGLWVTSLLTVMSYLVTQLSHANKASMTNGFAVFCIFWQAKLQVTSWILIFYKRLDTFAYQLNWWGNWIYIIRVRPPAAEILQFHKKKSIYTSNCIPTGTGSTFCSWIQLILVNCCVFCVLVLSNRQLKLPVYI